MKKTLKWIGILFGSLIGLVLLAAVVLYWMGGSRIARTHDVEPLSLEIPSDSAAIARGKHLSEAVTLCSGCHGKGLVGQSFIVEPSIATIYASNLTAGDGGIGARYSDADLVRAVRNGVNQEGRGLIIMHSDRYQHLTAGDLADIIAYVRSVPPVDNVQPAMETAALGRILVALGMFDSDNIPFISAEVIDHDAPFRPAITPEVSTEYGEYLATVGLCSMCHGSDLRGGTPIEEGAPPGPGLLAYGTPEWSDEQFLATIRTGMTPYGRSLDTLYMPAQYFGKMTDDELLSIRRYISSLVEG